MHSAYIFHAIFKHGDYADDNHPYHCPRCNEADSWNEGAYPDNELGE